MLMFLPETKEPDDFGTEPMEDIGKSITTLSEYPSNVTGHFCDLFVGNHIAHGKVALKRPRIKQAEYTSEDVRVSTSYFPLPHTRTSCFLNYPAFLTRSERLAELQARSYPILHRNMSNCWLPLHGVAFCGERNVD